MLLVTGGAGFIGSNFVEHWIQTKRSPIVNLDKLTYAGNLNNLASLEHDERHTFVEGDIGDRALVRGLLRKHRPRAIVHFAAETHVDRSIHHPEKFIFTNIVGSYAFLDECLHYWKQLEGDEKKAFRFLNISTDEVYGDSPAGNPPTSEASLYLPNSPYAASKASFDHLVRAFTHTFSFPAITTHSSNNFGPYQFPEKLIPLVIVNALQGKQLPIYGDGLQVRNWIYVKDNCKALCLILDKGRCGETYNVGGKSEITNLALVEKLCTILDELRADSAHVPHNQLIKHIKDRPGHDRRYSLSSAKICKELGWHQEGDIDKQLRDTVAWYLEHLSWLENVLSGEYRSWITAHYSGSV